MKNWYARFVLWVIGPALEVREKTRAELSAARLAEFEKSLEENKPPKMKLGRLVCAGCSTV